MILVDIYVPSVDNVYDFQLDEDATISDIIGEVGELIGQKEHSDIVGSIDDLMLCTRKTNRVLPKENTLRECAVQTGDSLILV